MKNHHSECKQFFTLPSERMNIPPARIRKAAAVCDRCYELNGDVHMLQAPPFVRDVEGQD